MTVRRLSACIAAATVCSLLAGSASPAAPRPQEKRLSSLGLGTGTRAVHDLVISGRTRRLQRLELDGWGGTYRATGTGELVTVFSSRAYPVDDAANQSIADFLAGLVHGDELPLAKVYVAPAGEVEELCAAGADGCYFPATAQLIVIGQDSLFSSVEEVLTHEYGHHVAMNRLNTPWDAAEWGTKRWASLENVCRKRAQGLAFPGDEGAHYRQNPGEAFAESYLHLNEVRAGASETPWGYDAAFRPSSAALDAIERDVLEPWTATSAHMWKGRFTRRGSTGTRRLATPLDGTFSMRLSAPAGSRLAAVGSKSVRSSSRTAIRGTVCGERTLVARARGGARGSFTATALVP